MPYNDWYKNNEFTVSDSADAEHPLTDKEKESIRTYAKGMELTDEATKQFLEELDAIDKPITVVFYGDHLPGVYKTAGADEKNSIALHLTDYFIWSNQASEVQGTKLDDSAYTSPHFFIAQAAEQMDAKVSPYLAFLTDMHGHIAAMEPPVPYNDWYKNNEFTVSDSADAEHPLTDKEKESIRTYAKGMELTDEATKQFLEELDAIDKPITVVFYGDHLPGVYKTAGADEKNSIALHLTDYFIWSNQASEVQGTKLDDSAYTSPHFFIAQAAEQMDAKVSPYLAFLTDMHGHIAAMEPPVVNTIQGWDRIPHFFIAQAAEQMDAKVSPYLAFLTDMHGHIAAMEPPVVNTIQGWDRIPEGQAIYLNQQGEPMSVADMDAATKQLLEDYKLIQYDITAGNNYLKDMEFMELPK